MTTYLVDASVVAEYLLAGHYAVQAQRFFHRALASDHFAVPELCLAECTNVIWKAVRFQGMPEDMALQAVRDLRKMPLQRHSTRGILHSALTIGLRQDLPVYDSLYIALAARSRYPFVTLDRRQERAARAENIVIFSIMDLS